MRKLFDNIKVLSSLTPASRTADTNGTGIDTQGYGDAVLVVPAGVIDTGDANETYAVNVEESDDNSTFTAVSGLSVTVTTSSQVKLLRIAELGTARKRYLRAVLDVGGTTPSIIAGALFILSEANQGPINLD